MRFKGQKFTKHLKKIAILEFVTEKVKNTSSKSFSFSARKGKENLRSSKKVVVL